jgi:hypothetical protein
MDNKEYVLGWNKCSQNEDLEKYRKERKEEIKIGLENRETFKEHLQQDWNEDVSFILPAAKYFSSALKKYKIYYCL